MSALDEVAALPGGGAVAAVVAQVEVNPAAARATATGWAEAVGDCVGHAGTVRAAVADVTQDWQGSSATAFTAFMGRFGAAAHGAQQALNTAAVTLRGVAGTLEEAQVSVESICEKLLGEVSRLRAAHPRATSAQLNDQISGLTGEAADAARVKVAEAQQTLILARHTLSGDLSRLSRTFSALPAAGTADFMRGWGTPAGWRATSRGDVSGTGNGTAGSDGPASPDSGGAPGPPGSGGAPLPSAASSPPSTRMRCRGTGTSTTRWTTSSRAYATPWRVTVPWTTCPASPPSTTASPTSATDHRGRSSRPVPGVCETGTVMAYLILVIVIGVVLVVGGGLYFLRPGRRARGGPPEAPPAPPAHGQRAGPGMTGEGGAAGTIAPPAPLPPDATRAPEIERPPPSAGRMVRLRARLARSQGAFA